MTAVFAAVSPLTWYAEDQAVGKGLNYTYTVWSSSTANANANVEFPGAPAKVGDVAVGQNNSRWVFVQASSTITAGNMIYITPSFKANNLPARTLGSLASWFGPTQQPNLGNFGFAQFNNGSPSSIMLSTTQVMANTNDYFWALLEATSGIQVNIGSTSCQAGIVTPQASGLLNGSIVTTLDNSSSASAAFLLNLYINTSLDATTSSVSQVATDCFTIGRVKISLTTTT